MQIKTHIGFNCWTALFITTVVAAGQLTVPKTTEADLGSTVTLQCRLETEGRWYVIVWYRIHDNGSDTLLVSLPSGHMVPDWNPDIPKALRTRIQPLISAQSALVEFHLVITPLMCEDGGQYQCRAIAAFGEPKSSTMLIIRQPPGSPRVTVKHHSWTLNTTLTVLCQADAGLPPQEFLWYYKTASMRNFQIVDRQKEVVYHNDSSCRVTALRALHVQVTPESRGTVYRCALPGKVEDKAFYDEITVQLPPLYTEVSADTSLQDDSACQHSSCGVKVETKKENSCSRNKGRTLTTIVAGYVSGLAASALAGQQGIWKFYT